MIGKSRIDVWQPKLKQIDISEVGTSTPPAYETLMPARWVTLETPESLITNQKRGNALAGLSISDSLYNARTAQIRIANKCDDYRAIYDNNTTATIAATTYTHTYNDSDGNDAAGGTRQLPRNWGLYTNFFYEFQFIRVVDTETNLVLFSGRIYKIDKKYEDGGGSVVVLECKDALEELNILSCKSLAKMVRFPSTWKRSDYIMYGLALAFNYHATNVKPAGGAEKSQLTPSNSVLGNTFNITNVDIATSTTQNSYSRFEDSATTVGRVVDWRLHDTGSRSLLSEFVRFAIAEPHEDETADDQFGYDFFVDSNIGSSNLSATTGPPAAQFNYVKRGNRLAKVSGTSQDPDTFGLTIHFPVTKAEIAQGHKTDSTGTQVAKKLMHRAFDFENPNDDLFTHGILTYNAIEDAAEEGEATSYKLKVEKDKKFEVIWVNYLNGQFTYKNKNIDDEWKKNSNEASGTDSAEVLDAYNAAGSLQAAGVARVQYQSNPGNASATADYRYLLLSDIGDVWVGGGTPGAFPTANYGSDNYVILRGATSGKQCRFNAEATAPQEGRPSQVWNIFKAFNLVKMNITHPDDLRVEMASKLAQASAEIRRGTYQITKAPYYWYDAKVISVGSTGGAGQRVAIKNINGSSSINITTFGFREGMLVHKMNSTFYGIEQANSKDVYGYCFNMTDDSHMDIDLTESQTFSADDNIRLFIPIRAGDNIRVDNTLADVFGDHIVTETEYNEYMGPISQIQSIGANEARKAGAVAKRTLWTAISKAPADEKANANVGNTKGNQFAKFDGTFVASAANQITWYGPGGAGTVGNLTTMDGTTFQIVASTTSDGTHGLGGSGMTGTNKYVMYVDPDGENPATNAYHIKTLIYASYKQDADNINIATCSVGDPLANMNGEQVKASGDGSPLKADGATIIHNESMTTALLKKGARAWTSNLQINGTAFNAISWSAATLTFANGDTVTLNAGSETSIATGTSFLFIDGVSGSVTPELTTSQSGCVGDAKILMATVTVSSATDGDKPTIFPFNSKYPTLSAVVLSGDLIKGDHIRGETISAGKLTVTAQESITEKTITTVSNSAPTSPTPRTGDIWFDTSGSITVIKVYDATTSPYWIVRNDNAPEGGGGNKITSISGAGTTPTSSTGSPQTLGDRVINITDFLEWTWDTNIGGSNKWRGVIATDAIHNGETTIQGGFINTQKIVLNDGGSSNTIFATGGVAGAPVPPPSNPAARVELTYTGLYGYSSSGTSNEQFSITSNDGKAKFGGGKVIANSDGLEVRNDSNNMIARLKKTMGIGMSGGYNAGVWFQRLHGNDEVFAWISAGTGTSSTYGANSAGFDIMTLYEDIILQATYQDIGLFPKPGGGSVKKEGYVKIGDRPIVFMDTQYANNIHSSSMDFVGFWKKDGAISYSTVYRLPWAANSSGTSPSDGQALMIDGTPTEMDGTSLSSAGTPSNPIVYNLKWATPSGSGGHTHAQSLNVEVGMLTVEELQDYGTQGIEIWSNLHPLSSDTYDMGTSTKYWGDIYADNHFNQSDKRHKTSIEELTNSDALSFITRLTPRSYKRIKRQEDGSTNISDTIHYGLVAQEVEEVLTGLGIDKTNWGGISIPETETVDIFNKKTGEMETLMDMRGLTYNEFIAPLIGAVKELKARIEVLEGN